MGLFQKVLIITTATFLLTACGGRWVSEEEEARLREQAPTEEVAPVDTAAVRQQPPEAPVTPSEEEEVATLQETDTRFRVESDFPLCAEYQFESVEMTPSERTYARGQAAEQACGNNARLPIQDGLIDLPNGRRIHFNARALNPS